VTPARTSDHNMRSRELLRRLARLEPPDEEPPNTVDTSGLSRVEECKLFEIWAALRFLVTAKTIDGEELHPGLGSRVDLALVTTAEVQEFFALLRRCPMVDPGEAGQRERETREEKRKRLKLEAAFGGAFHDYAIQYPYIAAPNYYTELNEYRHDLGYRLFEKYGWVVGERDCSGILPLDQWAPEDRDRLIDLYQRANPACSAAFPPGWKPKYKVGRVFYHPL
jgi:hypothetical protein